MPQITLTEEFIEVFGRQVWPTRNLPLAACRRFQFLLFQFTNHYRNRPLWLRVEPILRVSLI